MSQQENTLDFNKSFQILAQYVESAQQKGAYVLQEAELLKRAIDVTLNNAEDKEVDKNLAANLLVQGVQKGQRHGAYTLSDAALLHKVINFLVEESQKNLNAAQGQTAAPQNPVKFSQPESDVQEEEDDSNDLSELAQPVPLKPKEI